MKKIILLFSVLFCLISKNQFAQAPIWLFEGGTGSTGSDNAKAVCADVAGNVYVTGTFNNTVDFDFSGGTTNLVSNGGTDIFIASYTSAGFLRWAVRAGGVTADNVGNSGGICTDGTNVYVTGNYSGAGTLFGPFSLTPVGGNDTYIAKLNATTGAWTWAVSFGGAGNTDYGAALCLDPLGNLYVLGQFNATINPGACSATALGGSGSDLFVEKVNPATGACVWLSSGGTSANTDLTAGGGICYNPLTTDLVVAANFNGANATYGGFTVTNSGSVDMAVIELSSATGAFLGAVGSGTINGDDAQNCAFDPATGDIMVVGNFNGGNMTVPGGITLVNSGLSDSWVGRYNEASNTFLWAKAGGGTNQDKGFGICVDGTGSVLVSGSYSSNPATFGAQSLTNTNSGGFDDAYVVGYSATTGTELWSTRNTNSGAQPVGSNAKSIAIQPSTSNYWVCGQYAQGCTFGALGLMNSAGFADVYVAKLLAPPPLSATQSQVNLTCNGVCTGSGTVVASGGTTPYTYSWSPSGGSGATASSLCAGNYTCTITDGGSSSITKTFNITQPPALTSSLVSQTNISCFGGSNGAATITASGGTGSLVYNWTPGNPTGDGTVSVTGLTAATWTCTITDANGCTKTQTANITQPTALTSSLVSQTNISCFGGSNGAATITAGGGAGGYTYNWTPGNPTGDGTVSVNGLTAGTWTCTITDANGCTKTQTANITAPTAIAVSLASQTNISCFGGSNGAASINTPTGGTGVYTYNWTPGNPAGDGTVSVTGLTAGTWTCTVTDANSCTATQTVNITAPTAIAVSLSSQTNISCNGGSNGAATINNPTGGAGGYTYNWTPGNPTGDGTVSVTGLTAATWTCTVADANGCTATQTVNITAPTAIAVSLSSQTNISCNGGSNGAATINVPTGGAGGYTYNWTPGNPTGDGTVSVTGLTAATWTCTVTDANGCTATQTANITQPTALTSSLVSQTNISCFGGSNGAASITAGGGAGGYTYNWTPGNPTGDGTVSVTGLTAGTWTCTITDINGCTKTQTANITQPTAIAVSLSSQTNISCNGGSNGAATLNVPTGGAGGYTYNWTPGNPTGDGTVSVTGLTAGTWTCTVTDANGCTATQTANITQPTAVTAGSSFTPTSCSSNTGTATVTPSGGTGGYTYSWAPSGGTAATATALAAGSYTCTITDANSCGITKIVVVSTASGPTLTAASQTNISCNGGSNGAASVNAATGGTPSYTYNWTPGNPTGDGTVSVTGLTAGTWTCTVTDGGGCTATQTLNITQPTAIAVSLASQTNVSCNGGSNGAATISTPTGGAGGFTYNWTPGNPTGDGTVSVTGLTAATWTCTVTDANGCTATQTAAITQPPVLSLSLVATSVTCNGTCNGSATATPTGGTPTYNYSWNTIPVQTTQTATGVCAGTYTCTVTDANGCVATQTIIITQPPVLTATISSTSTGCSSNTGTATVVASGGTSGYNYSWAPSGGTAATASGLGAGTYTCTITDANGCFITRSITVTTSSAPSASIASQTNVTCFGACNGSVTISATGGLSPYTYAWTPSGGTAATASALCAGSYTCTVTGTNGCSSTQTVIIAQPALLVASSSATAVLCNGGTAVVSVTVTGGTGPFTGGGTFTVTAGTYNYTVTDGNGCTANTSITITEPSALTASSSATSISCNGGSATITVTGAGGTLPYTGAGTFTVAAGTYNYTVTDANGCTANTSVTVTEPLVLAVSSSATTIMCNGGTADVTVSAMDGTGPYTGTGTFTVSAGTYNYTVTDANGCTANTSITVTEPLVLTASSSATTITCNGGTADVTVSAMDGTGPYTGTGTFTVTAGTYNYTVTDANGCTANTSITVTEPTAITSSVSTTSSNCGAATGTATVTASGGTGILSYSWSSGGSSATETGLAAASYTVTITDASGCSSTDIANVSDSGAPTVTLTTVDVSCYGSCDGSITANVTGGTLPINLDWSPGSPSGDGTSMITNLCAGTYTIAVSDGAGCSTLQSGTVSEPAAIDVTTTLSGTTITANYATATSYQWIDCGTSLSIAGETNPSFTATVDGDYSVMITDGSCSQTSTCVTVVGTGIAQSDLNNQVTVYPNPNNGMFVIKSSLKGAYVIVNELGQVVYSFELTPENNFSKSIEGLNNGIYFIRGTNNNNLLRQKIVVTK